MFEVGQTVVLNAVSIVQAYIDHSGKKVQILELPSKNFEAFKVRAEDGWIGFVFRIELEEIS